MGRAPSANGKTLACLTVYADVDVTNVFQSISRLIKEFERDARADGMPASELADRRRALVASLNKYIEVSSAESRQQHT